MKLLVLADEAPVFPLSRLVETHRPDAVVTLGDLDAELLDPMCRFDVPVLGVYGNHDDGRYLEAANRTDLHLRSARLGELTFAGFQGCVRYRRGAKLQYGQREASRMARRIPKADVLLSHAPPRGVHEEPDDPAHEGFDGLRAYVESVQPRLSLHGHTPSPPRQASTIGTTRVLHVVGHRVVELLSLADEHDRGPHAVRLRRRRLGAVGRVGAARRRQPGDRGAARAGAARRRGRG